MNTLEKQKRIYFLFTSLENMEQHDKTICQFVVDYFIDNGNNYAKLSEIALALLEKNQFNISPESLDEIIKRTSKVKWFEDYNEMNIALPFRLKPDIYDTISTIGGLIDELQEYVRTFLSSKGYNIEEVYSVIEILLETLFRSNLRYLKDILTKKQERALSIAFGTNNNNFSADANKYYNDMLIDASEQFDILLSKLVLRMFDFLSLNCSIDKNSIVTRQLANKKYYLDSSFILRLLGFDNEFRENRSIELIKILKTVKGCKFYVHSKTLEEAQSKIDQIITCNQKLLVLAESNTSNLYNIIQHIGEKTSNVLNLFTRLKNNNIVSNFKDFKLRFGKIQYLLYSIISTDLEIDKARLPYRTDSNRNILAEELSLNTSKTFGRIDHIVKLLDYIDSLRKDNCYNPFDIEYWLITTDQNTLQLDNADEVSDDNRKSICIMPTELIRMIDGTNEIVGEHLDAFKKFIMNSHGYATNYTQQEIDTVVKLTTMVDSIPTYEAYDVELYINNFFQTYTWSCFADRLKGLNDREQNEAIVETFLETNKAFISNQNISILYRLKQEWERKYSNIFNVMVYFIPISVFIYIVLCYICKLIGYTHKWVQPDYIDFIVFIFDSALVALCPYISKKYKRRFVEYFIQKHINKYK